MVFGVLFNVVFSLIRLAFYILGILCFLKYLRQ